MSKKLYVFTETLSVFTRRVAVFAAIAIVALSMTAIGSSAARFSFLDSVKEFFGIEASAPAIFTAQTTTQNTAEPNTLNETATAEAVVAFRIVFF